MTPYKKLGWWERLQRQYDIRLQSRRMCATAI